MRNDVGLAVAIAGTGINSPNNQHFTNLIRYWTGYAQYGL